MSSGSPPRRCRPRRDGPDPRQLPDGERRRAVPSRSRRSRVPSSSTAPGASRSRAGSSRRRSRSRAIRPPSTANPRPAATRSDRSMAPCSESSAGGLRGSRSSSFASAPGSSALVGQFQATVTFSTCPAVNLACALEEPSYDANAQITRPPDRRADGQRRDHLGSLPQPALRRERAGADGHQRPGAAPDPAPNRPGLRHGAGERVERPRDLHAPRDCPSGRRSATHPRASRRGDLRAGVLERREVDRRPARGNDDLRRHGAPRRSRSRRSCSRETFRTRTRTGSAQSYAFRLGGFRLRRARRGSLRRRAPFPSRTSPFSAST